MSLMYSWATPEYLLWGMTIGQLVMWHNAGIQIKYPNLDKDKRSLKNMSKDERKRSIEEARKQWRESKALEAEAERAKLNDAVKEQYRELYGDV